MLLARRRCRGDAVRRVHHRRARLRHPRPRAWALDRSPDAPGPHVRAALRRRRLRRRGTGCRALRGVHVRHGRDDTVARDDDARYLAHWCTMLRAPAARRSGPWPARHRPPPTTSPATTPRPATDARHRHPTRPSPDDELRAVVAGVATGLRANLTRAVQAIAYSLADAPSRWNTPLPRPSPVARPARLPATQPRLNAEGAGGQGRRPPAGPARLPGPPFSSTSSRHSATGPAAHRGPPSRPPLTVNRQPSTVNR